MATAFLTLGRDRAKPIGPDGYERVLAVAATLLFMAAFTAVARGRAGWAHVPALVWLHLGTVLTATALTPVILLRRRGDGRHRWLGRVWIGAMLGTALLSFGVTTSHPGHWSPIHLLSAYVVVQAPLIWWAAATHRVQLHRGMARGMVTGALVIAGFFTFPFGRLLGDWLFG